MTCVVQLFRGRSSPSSLSCTNFWHSTVDWSTHEAIADGGEMTVQMYKALDRMMPLAVYRPQWKLCWNGFDFGCVCSRVLLSVDR